MIELTTDDIRKHSSINEKYHKILPDLFLVLVKPHRDRTLRTRTHLNIFRVSGEIEIQQTLMIYTGQDTHYTTLEHPLGRT